MLTTTGEETGSQPDERPPAPAATIPHLIFVHGTGAGAETNHGERWWQRGSPFREELSQRLDLDRSRVVLQEFMWGKGPNFESQRRKAGQDLFAELQRLEAAGAEYYLVGHSHGGSVIYSALIEGMRRGEAFKGLKMWCTVGTPFLDYRANRWIFQRLNQFELPLFGAGLLALMLAACCALLYVLGVRAAADSFASLMTIAIALSLVGTLTLWGVSQLDKTRRTWFSPRQKKALAEQHGDTWIGLYHKEDEAISALDNVRRLEEQIIPKTFLRPFAAATQLTMFAIIGIYLMVETLRDDWSTSVEGSSSEAVAGQALMTLKGKKEVTEPEPAIAAIDTSMSSIRHIAETGTFPVFEIYAYMPEVPFVVVSSIQLVVDALVSFAILLGVLYAVGALLTGLAWLFSPSLSGALNRLIWSTIRRRAWGDDLVKEDVGEISSHPAEFARRFGPLPEVISAQLNAHADNNAIRALQKVRVVLGMSEKQKPLGLTSELSQTLVWEELIHTSYFRVPEFIDLLAIALNRAGFSQTKDGFALGPQERAELTDWLSEAQVTPAFKAQLADTPRR